MPTKTQQFSPTLSQDIVGLEMPGKRHFSRALSGTGSVSDTVYALVNGNVDDCE